MRLIRHAMICASAVALIAAAYLAGGFTASLLAADTHAMAPRPVPISIENAEKVAAL